MRQPLSMMSKVLADFSASAATAGFIAVVTGYTSSLALMVQAGRNAGLDEHQIGSWVWAISVAMGLTAIALTFRYRMPVVVAWSTPGAALLVTSLSGVSYPEAIGAFVATGLLLTLTGLFRPLAELVRQLPSSIAAALLAGILFSIGVELFRAVEDQTGLVLAMLALFFLTRRYRPVLAVPVALLAGCTLAWFNGLVVWPPIDWTLVRPIWTTPEFSFSAMTSIALPLYVVAMASQNLPGLAVLRADGYEPPPAPLIATTGLASLIFAPFGSHGVNLAAISAALCTGPGAHADTKRRYPAALVFGVLAIGVGCFAVALTAVFMALPHALVMSVAGLALLGSIGNGLAQSMGDHDRREAALVTFMVTASGVSLFSIGSAFWGLVAGLAVLLLARPPNH
ncbi:benzoate/H(+) symporter BenE family transporter [Halopseudomonas nanhaiensis]|uniref:benzoate/H(+) symporter BenE family transporter n=1 Tax=Halopseudomonas nanhaiensis TaxID=2830842 RepID=UPI001CC0A285|nr:benzoate/H(+) symporter BenE family transporter [Halopseudomonas nanhaiensis]UAW99878.1 benzoate/H(+) symporter BenE family transporter [Halopseudomonas nanhaiensis]